MFLDDPFFDAVAVAFFIVWLVICVAFIAGVVYLIVYVVRYRREIWDAGPIDGDADARRSGLGK
ncbi:hypothetical protein LQ757_05950 [Agromyces sp. SYSU K20354]|uniref:hypothetical protein n=1 Tax=Agromyces cavernae TaxID=2898659 RepID=UPI001E2FDBEE|nr:hypothetical protein [Agromyces cavernae]MCD2441819.1 hypothetical protein [Agromyces cavernae]